MPSSRPAPVELLAALAPVLAAWGDRWYVFGAQAVLVWGRPRLTADVDVTAHIHPEHVGDFIRSIEHAGFELRVPDVEAFVARTRVLPCLHRATGLPLDIVLAESGLEELFLSRAVPVDLGGVRVPVIAAEDLIVTKILAGRPKDLDDVDGVLRERLPSLDLGTIRATLGLLEEALSRSDLRLAFDAALTRVSPPASR